VAPQKYLPENVEILRVPLVVLHKANDWRTKAPLSINTLKAIIDVSLQDFLATDTKHRGIPPAADTGISRSLKLSTGLSRENPESAPEDASTPPSRPPPPPPHVLSGALSRELEGIGAAPESPVVARARRHAEKLFKPLEEYIRTSFSSWECLNASFSQSSGTENSTIPEPQNEESAQPSRDAREVIIPVTNNPGEKEALMLTVGRAARRERANSRNERASRSHETRPSFRPPPGMDWDLAHEFYNLVLNVGRDALANLSVLRQPEGEAQEDPEAVNELGYAIDEARINMVDVLLKSTEGLLKRPGRPLKKPEDIRFLLVILANPLLYPGAAQLTSSRPLTLLVPSQAQAGVQHRESLSPATRKPSSAGSSSMNHSAILKRIFGLLSNLPNECHHFLITWFSIMPENHFLRLVELGGSFITYRIGRQDTKKTLQRHNVLRGKLPYSDDWQIKAMARVMALLEKANNNSLGRRKHLRSLSSSGSAAAWRQEAHSRGQIIPSSSFYNMRVDYCDLIADFDAWESKLAKFCFCQYPFFLSMGAKIQILEHDARRQMEIQARNAFITNISNRTALSQYMVLRVRRECLVEDSLKGISESAGTIDDLKKGLKVEFVGEDGIDAGGLKKEWFLMVAREVFDPNHGMLAANRKATDTDRTRTFRFRRKGALLLFQSTYL
jgi:E3 ubiquitin-protein ligase HECTD2